MQSLYQKITASFNKWMGKPVDFDWQYANQCVDWIKQYAKDVGYPITTSGNAKDFINLWLGDNWKPVKQWQVWDIVIFPTGEYWHIATVFDIKSNIIYVMEQNRDGKAYANNNPDNIWSRVSVWSYKLKGNEVFYRNYDA